MNRTCRQTTNALALFLVGLLPVAPALGAPPAAVSPGEAARFAPAASPCPTFSWAATSGALGHELVVYAVDPSSGALLENPTLSARLPGQASSWTPSAERCFRPGRYAWAVRATVEDELPAAWSEAMLFEVSERPSAAELEHALEVVRRHLGSGGELLGVPAARSHVGERADVRRDAGDRSVVSRAEPADVPERVTSAAGSEPAIVLGGTPVARLAASDFARSSAGAVSFDFHNPGAGAMTLTVDSVEVVTTATDQDTTYLAGNQLGLNGTTLDVEEGSGSGLDADLLDGQSSAAFVTVASDPYVDETGDTMTGLLTLNPSSGFALQTGSGDSIDLGTGANLFQGGVSLLRSATGTIGVGLRALDANTGASNTAVGTDALGNNTTATDNTAVGYEALYNSTAGANTAVGSRALDANTTGTGNTAVGNQALTSNTTGVNNIAVGNGAGNGVTTGSNNIDIGTSSAGAEIGKIRIGVQGTATETFIAGIWQTTTTGGAAVFVNNLGKLGTATSSRRFKEEIADVGASSELLLALRPVSFRYRPEALGTGPVERPLEFGLIAEEVAEVFPELVIYDENGAPYTVRYHLLVPLLLAELQREHEENVLQRAEIEELRRLVTRGDAVQSPGG